MCNRATLLMRPVMLAAGRGNRLGTYTEDIPKLFVEVNGKTILDWQIEALSPLVDDGIVSDELTLILGHGFEDIRPENPRSNEKLQSFLPENSPFNFHVVSISNWDQVENATSARRAIETIDDHALLMCGDVILTENALRRIVETFEDEYRPDGVSAVGAIKGIQDERTAVTWSENRTIGDYGAIEGHQEAGVFVLHARHFETARRLWKENGDDWFPIVFTEVPSKAALIDKSHHHEINTKRHLQEAKENLPFKN